jgi:hypothetical protein
MFDNFVWAAGIFLEGFLIVRGVQKGHFARYPVFFSYLSFVLLQSALRFTILQLQADWYRSVYWFTEFVGIIAGCSVVFEFCRLGLKDYPGVAKLARAGLFGAFLFTFSKVLFTAAQGSDGWTPDLTFLLERDLRFVQIAAMVTLVGIVLLYAIPMNRNLKGIILGYGLYLALVVTNLTYLGLFGERVQFVVTRIQASSYLAALLVWTVALWSYQPVVRRVTGDPKSYSAICAETKEQLAQSKSSVERVIS